MVNVRLRIEFEFVVLTWRELFRRLELTGGGVTSENRVDRVGDEEGRRSRFIRIESEGNYGEGIGEGDGLGGESAAGGVPELDGGVCARCDEERIAGSDGPNRIGMTALLLRSRQRVVREKVIG